jgi:hypothetical protein
VTGSKLRAIPWNRWTLERFGLTPSKLAYRVRSPDAPKVLCVSIPKAGTHLLERALCLHPRLYRRLVPTITPARARERGGVERLLARLRPGQVLMSHLRFEASYPGLLVSHGVEAVFLVRDPRDVVVSQVGYVSRRADHWSHALFASRADARDRLRLAIAGDPVGGLRSIGERLAAFEGWLEEGVAVVRFEDLIGPDGGGDAERQRRAVESLYRRIGLAADEDVVRSVCARLFSSDSPTFHKGAIGQWRDAFDDELLTLFEDVAGRYLERFGYAR